MKRKILVIILSLFILIIPRMYPLSIKTTVQPVSSCPGAYTVAIGVENCYNIGAISLKLNYDALNVTYLGYQNFNSNLSNGITVINAANGQVIVSWASVMADSIGTGTVVEFRFSSGTGTFPFQWSTGITGDCEYADTLGNILPSVFVSGNATVYQLPAIVQQPVNKTTYVGSSTSFYIGATGNGITYQWQVSSNNGTNWSDLSNTPPYSGTASSTLNITAATIGLSGNLYRCKIDGTCPAPDTSNAARLLVYQVINATAPTITPCAGTIVAPITVQNCNGVGAISLKLSFNNSLLVFSGFQNLNPAFSSGMYFTNQNNGEITFSWANTDPGYLGNATLFELVFTSGVGNAFLNWNNLVAGNCEFSDTYGNIINSTYVNGTINTLPPPGITSNPANKSILAGQNTSFTVSATGSGLTCQWQISMNGGGNWSSLANGAPYSGVTDGTLSITAATTGLNGYQYRCIVNGTCPPSVTSGAATLSVAATIPTITTTVGSVSNSCTGTISVPVTVTNCNNVGAISLVLLFDTTKLTFAGYYSVHTELTTGLFMVNRSGNKVILSCASLDPVNIGSGTLVQYRFIARGVTATTLTWDTQTTGNCEYSDIGGNSIPAAFTSGSISFLSNALIVNAGNDVEIQLGNLYQMNTTVTGGLTPLSYAWTPAIGLSNPSIQNPAASPVETTTYRLTVTGSNSCVSWDEIIITVNSTIPVNLVLDNITISSGSNVCFNAIQTVTVAGDGKQFLVQPGGHASIIAGQNILLKNGTTVANNGTLHAWITTNSSYCNSQKSFLEPVAEEPPPTNPFAQPGSSGIKVYPNPTHGLFTLELYPGFPESPVLVRIFNMMGAEVIHKQAIAFGKATFSLENVPAGIYLVSVMREGKSETVKIIIF